MPVMRFASLGSGSRGNATLVQSEDTLILIDCGFAVKEIERRCMGLGVSPKDISAILVTHEHADHIRGVGPAARRYDLPVWMTHGTAHASDCGKMQRRNFSSHNGSFTIGSIRIEPIPVPHDAREPSQFIFHFKQRRLGLLTDLGSVTSHISEILGPLDAMILEANHDPDMLKNGPYPASLKSRVGGDYGHLSNQQAADLLRQMDHGRLQHLAIGHISEKNNTHALVQDQMLSVEGLQQENLNYLRQDCATGWFNIH